MVLNKKQRDALPDGDYGLPEERRFPLIDKEHVLKAIQFFKYCPADKKKRLAANINKKASEFGMKINCKGEFAKYIDPKNTKSVDESCYEYQVKEASNIGTLSPIVGGIPAEPNHTEEELDEVDKIVLGFSEECCHADKADMHCKMHDYTNMMRKFHDSKQTKSIADIHYLINHSMHNFELGCMHDYVTNGFSEREEIFNTRKDIVEIIEDREMDKKTKIAKLSVILAAHTRLDEFNFLLQTMYVMDKSLCAEAIHMIMRMSNAKFTDKGINYVDMLGYLKPDKNIKSEYSKNCPNTIINDLYYFGNDIYNLGDYHIDQLVLDYLTQKGVLPKGPMIFTSDAEENSFLTSVRYLAITKSIDWYAFIHISRNLYKAFIGIDSNVYKLVQYYDQFNSSVRRPKYIAYKIGTMNGRELEMIPDIFVTDRSSAYGFKVNDNISIITTDPWTPKKKEPCDDCSGSGSCRKCEHHTHTSEGMELFNQNDNSSDLIKGIHIDSNKEPFLSIQVNPDSLDKLYNVCKDCLDKNFEEGNLEAAKENLSVELCAITSISNTLALKDVSDLYDSPFNQEIKRIRSLLSSNFKSNLRKLEKKERNFDFMNYFFENRLANADSSETKSLFTNSFETILYW